MTTEVETGLGSEFWLDDDAGVSTLLGELTNIPIPSGAADLLDASHYKTVGFRDYIQSPLRDGEEADLEMNWIPGSASDILASGAVGKTRDFKVVVPTGPDGDTFKFEGSVLVRNYVRENPREDIRKGTLTVKWVSNIVETLVPGP